ncbi:phytoene/squalene synthase family protein [Pseudahrensia aquimaris]|uniref:Phytoene/squalene synthase family protein n=1 Tax=Pseudahrensia aquimaris TaxID=744461 RepID=A0ABW3FKY0_9HYPH
MADARDTFAEELSTLNNGLRESSRDLYLATLLMPEPVRALASVLFAYHVDLSNISRLVSEPMAGAIRLQWWADVMNGERAGEAQAHPLARTVLALLEKHELSSHVLAEKAQAHEFDLFAEPMENRAMLEGYFGETRSVLFQLLCTALAGQPTNDTADAAGHAGVSTGIVASLFDFERRRQMRQTIVPQDMLRAAGMDDDRYFAAEPADLALVFEAYCDLAWEHHEKAAAAIANLPKELRGIFALCALTPTYLSARQAQNGAVVDLQPLSQLRTQWLLYRQKL